MNHNQPVQLSLDVNRHRLLDGDGILVGSLAIAGDLAVGRDLDPGEVVMVTVADEDGNVIASGHAAVGTVGFKPIVDAHVGVIGTERIHKAKLNT